MKTIRILCFAATLVVLSVGPLRSAPFTWDGGGPPSPNWSTAANWNPNGAPPDNGTADIFMAGSQTLSVVDAADGSWNILSLSFSSGAASFMITGSSSLTIGAGGITNDDNSTQTIETDVVLSAAQTWRNPGTGALDLEGNVNNSGHLLTFQADGAIRVLGSISGTGGLTKTGAGTLTFDATAKSYTGTTTVKEGTLLISDVSPAINGALVIGDGIGTNDTVTLSSIGGSKFAPTTDITVNSSGRLNLGGANTIDALVINGGFVGGGTSLTMNSVNITGDSDFDVSSGTWILEW